jgi:ribosomal protein S18 acetylase RimI-like enzyme
MRNRGEGSVVIGAAEEMGSGWCLQHLPTLVPWIHEASQPFADWYFGDAATAAGILGEWMRRSTSEVHLGRALVALDAAGGPLGCLVGMDGVALERCRAADFAALCEDLGGGPDASAVLEELVTASRALFLPVPHAAYYVSRVAVAPHARGQGLGQQLVMAALERARRTGCTQLHLDVSTANHGAIRTYGRVGLAVVATCVHEPSGLAYHRMSAPL